MSLRERLPAVEALAPERLAAVEDHVMASLGGVPARRRARARAGAWVAVPAMAAVLVGLWVMLRPVAPGDGGGPMQVVTADSGTVVQWADATLRVAPHTRLTLTRGDGVLVALERGEVDCDVVPRGGRPAFRVGAGDVTVSVVGTRFGVGRTEDAVTVSVAHGRVSVQDASGTRMLNAGESWASSPLAVVGAGEEPSGADAPVTAPQPTQPEPRRDTQRAEEPAPDASPAPPRRPFSSSAPNRAESEPVLTPGSDPKLLRQRSLGSGKPAAAALHELVVLTRDVKLAEEYAVRFPRGEHAAEVSWVRVSALCDAGRRAECRAAAHQFADAFPDHPRAVDARRIAAE